MAQEEEEPHRPASQLSLKNRKTGERRRGKEKGAALGEVPGPEQENVCSSVREAGARAAAGTAWRCCTARPLLSSRTQSDPLAPKSSVRIHPHPVSLLCREARLPQIPVPSQPAVWHPGPKGDFLLLLQQQAEPELWGFHCSRVLGKLGRPCLGKQLTPNVQFQIFSNPSKYTAPQLFYDQDHCQGNPRSLISLVPSPCRERLAPGPRGLRTDGAHPLPPLIPSRAPFLSHPLSPSASSSSNTNCLHGKSPSMTRFSTHKRKLWATDPTS